jgi:hypothetical protein
MVMTGTDHILLVEGESDRAFFEQICKVLGLDTRVTVAPPKSLAKEGAYNSKEGIFNYLPTLLGQLADGQTSRLAVVVDADSTANGGGYTQAIKKITDILTPHGFFLAPNTVGGIVFKHNDGLADFGLWVMPNNSDEGMLEDWIKQCIHPNEQDLFTHAKSVVATLPSPKFKPIHLSKAEVATWLAWQKQPGHGPYRAVEDKLIDPSGTQYKNLIAWLNHIFPTHS